MSLFGELLQCCGRDRNETSLGGKKEQLSCKVVLLVVEDDESPLLGYIVLLVHCLFCVSIKSNWSTKYDGEIVDLKSRGENW